MGSVKPIMYSEEFSEQRVERMREYREAQAERELNVIKNLAATLRHVREGALCGGKLFPNPRRQFEKDLKASRYDGHQLPFNENGEHMTLPEWLASNRAIADEMSVAWQGRDYATFNEIVAGIMVEYGGWPFDEAEVASKVGAEVADNEA